MTASSTDDLASAERRIQELNKELSQARSELAEAREQQTATGGILRAISNSPTDLQGIFQEIATTAARLCDAYDAGVLQCAGDHLRLVALRGQIPGQGIVPLSRGVVVGRAILDRTILQVPDTQAETEEYPEGSEIARRLGHRTIVAVPLIRGREALGAIFVRRTEVRPFTDRQIELLKIFADQAVIAIENTRLFDAEQTRTKEVVAKSAELRESLEYQTATGEVLSVISRSPNDVKPVLDTIARIAQRLCQAEHAFVLQREQDGYRLVAANDALPDWVSAIKATPLLPGRGSLTGRVALERRTVHVDDLRADPEYVLAPTLQRGVRSELGVPLMQHGEVIGVIIVGRTEVRPFTDRQIALIETFADQAVIAIENARLFEAEQASKRELQESLEYQTATSDVLGVISRSPTDLQPVFDAIAQAAAQLCRAQFCHVCRFDGKLIHFAAAYGLTEEGRQALQSGYPLAPGRATATARSILSTRVEEVPDVHTDPDYAHGGAAMVMKLRSAVAVPMLKDNRPIGAIGVARSGTGRFPTRQIELLRTFADQAVIAIENTRLFEAEQASKRELTEALEQQTATADVLKVISRSALDVQKVLDALVESAAHLCNAYDAAIFQVVGDSLRLVAHHGQIPMGAPVGQLTVPLVRGLIGGRAVIERRTVQVADVLAEGDEYPESRSRAALQPGYRTVLAAPLVHAGEAIGVIFIRRDEVRPFTERQVELVNTFADQAVIAIENTRLFEEVQARTRELAKTVEDLEIASQHKNQFVANMSHELRTPLAAILGYAELIQEGFYEPQGPKSLDALTRIRSNGKHLLGLINTVLDIAKIESGQFTLNVAEYALESVVETVRSATESLAQNKKLALKTEVARSLPIGLGDEQRLTQVLLNLVGNAIKFTDVGEVRVIAKAINGHFNVSVADTGPGIPEQEQKRIFEQFHQIDSSLTKAKGGTGLGLAIAKQIVEMHGGRIWVESTPGKGATFQMELPTRAELRKSAP
jgi:signal transduction histidine kinase